MTPPVVTLVGLAGPLVAIRPADVDGDGVRELVAATTAPEGPVDLSILRLRGSRVEQTHHRLPDRPGWWDAGHGLWLLDSAGLHELRTGQSPLGLAGAAAGAGPPAPADMVTDLDHDGTPELLLPGDGVLHAWSVNGRAWGTVPLPEPATVAVADVNADGTDDLVLVTDDGIRVHVAAPGALSTVALHWPLPEALAPPPPGHDTDAGETSARWTDLDGDGLADLLVHRLRDPDRPARAVSEVFYYRGRGTAGLAPPQRITSQAGARDLFAVDLDGDGDREVLQPRLRLDGGNLARAVLGRSVEVELVALPMEEGRLLDPVQLRQVSLPVDGTRAAWSMFEDLTGDGLPDLAMVIDGRLDIFAGRGMSVDRQPCATASLGVQADNLWALDLSGDGAAELVAWARGERALAIVEIPRPR
ncbi:MAG: VCBS repeat-containing protein [Deltaproteobacteria bacterium]|nr:MAG: VCBS repeat-containing protein [Deltaproteobacteria bacterium]